MVMSTACQGNPWHRHLPQACRQSTTREAIAIHSTSRAPAMATSCSWVRGTLPASIASHPEAVMPARRAVSSMERPLAEEFTPDPALERGAAGRGERRLNQSTYILITPDKAAWSDRLKLSCSLPEPRLALPFYPHL